MKDKIMREFKGLKEQIKENTYELYSIDDFMTMDEGMGTVEVILIIVVLIGLVLIFKKQIRAVVETIMNKISSDSDAVMS